MAGAWDVVNAAVGAAQKAAGSSGGGSGRGSRNGGGNGLSAWLSPEELAAIRAGASTKTGEGGFSASDPSTWKVYLGSQMSGGQGRPANPTIDNGSRVTSKIIDGNAAMQRPYEWSQKRVDEVKQRMRASGYDVNTFDDVVKVWCDLVGRSAQTYEATGGKRQLTPWDVLDLAKRENPDAVNKMKAQNPWGEGPRVVSTTQTNTSVNELDDGAAWQIMQQAASNALGREVSDEEVREFAFKANRLAADDPDKVTTKQTTDRLTGNSDVTTSSKAGFSSADAQKMAQDDLRDTPEAGAYQAATTYYNAFVSALDSVV